MLDGSGHFPFADNPEGIRRGRRPLPAHPARRRSARVNAVEISGPGAERLAAELGEAIEHKRLRALLPADRLAARPRRPRGRGAAALAPQRGRDPRAGGLHRRRRASSTCSSAWSAGRSRPRSSSSATGVGQTDLDVSLNLSDDHIYAGTLPDEIRAAAQRHDVATRRLSLEVPRRHWSRRTASGSRSFRRCSTLGVGLMIDDYSGAVPANQLVELPTTALKISRRVVAGIPDVPRSTEIAADCAAPGRRSGRTGDRQRDRVARSARGSA